MSTSSYPPSSSSHRQGPWIVAVITVSGAIITQLIQMHVAEADKLQYLEAGVTLVTKFDKVDAKLNALSARITAIEVQREQEAEAAARPAPLIKGKHK